MFSIQRLYTGDIQGEFGLQRTKRLCYNRFFCKSRL